MADDTSRGSPDRSAKRKRITHACKACSAKKTKCDGATPCSGCAAVGLHCEYGQQKKRGPPKGFKHGQPSSIRPMHAALLPEQQPLPSLSQTSYSGGLPTPSYSFPPPPPGQDGMPNPYQDATRLTVQPSGVPPNSVSPRSRPTDVFSLGPTLATSAPGQPPPPQPYMYMPANPQAMQHDIPTPHRSLLMQGASHAASSHPPHSALGLHHMPQPQFPSNNALPFNPESSEYPPAPDSSTKTAPVTSPSSSSSSTQQAGTSNSSSSRQQQQQKQATSNNGPPLRAMRRRSWDPPSVSIEGQRLQRLDQVRQIRLPSISEGFGHYDFLVDGAYKSSDSSLGLYRGSTSGLPNLAREQARRAIPGTPALESGGLPVPMRTTTFPMHELEGLSVDTIVPPTMMEELMRVYFAWVQPLWPILYRPRPEQRTPAYAAKLPMLMNAMCSGAAAIIDPRQHGMDCSNKALSALFRFRAQRIFGETRCEASIEAVQALHLMALVENANGYCSIAWQLVGLSGRMSLDLGLHRNHKLYRPDIDEEELEDSTRAFSGAYCSDKMLSAWLGRPTSIHEQDIDAEFPEQRDVDELGRWQDRLKVLSNNNIKFDGEMRCVTYLRALVGLLATLDSVLCRVYSIRRRRNYREEQDLSIMEEIVNQLQEWHDNLPPSIAWTHGQQVLPHLFVLHLWYAITRLLLHRTFIPLRQASWQICTDAAEDIFAIMTQYDNEYGLQVIASTATYAVFTAAVMFIANAASPSADIAADARRKSKQCIVWLDKIGECWRDASRYSRILTNLEDVGQDQDSHIQPEQLASRVPRSTTPHDPNPAATASTTESFVPSPSIGNGADLLFWNELPISLDSSHWQNFTASYSNLLGSNGGAGDFSFMHPTSHS